jgi:hypothetical protein
MQRLTTVQVLNMKPENSFSQKTNIASLATIAGVLAFVIWMTSFVAQQDGFFTRTPLTSPASAGVHATPHEAADAGRSGDGAPAVGQG